MLSKWWRHALIASIDRSVKVNRLPNYRYVMELGIMLLIGDNCLKMLSDTRRLNKQQNQGKRSKCWDASRQKNLASGDSALTKTMRPNPIFFVPGRRIRRPRDPWVKIYHRKKSVILLFTKMLLHDAVLLLMVKAFMFVVVLTPNYMSRCTLKLPCIRSPIKNMSFLSFLLFLCVCACVWILIHIHELYISSNYFLYVMSLFAGICSSHQ